MKCKISLIFLIGLTCFTSCSKRIPRQLDTSSECRTPDGESGECFNIRQCPPLLDLLRNSRHKPGVADFLRKSVCGYDNSDPRVCCPRKIDVVPATQPGNNGGGRITEPFPNDDRNAGTNSDEYPELLSPPQCGHTPIQKTRIVGGRPADLGGWPWIAVLGYRSNRNPTTQWLCGGTIITNRHILTAAHCTKHPSLTLFKVRVGELDLDDSVSDGASPIDINVQRAIVHPSYNPSKYTDDIAILRLQNDIPFSTLIQPICLPKTRELQQTSFAKTFPFVAGWGSIQFKGPSLTALQEVQLPIVENEECGRAYRTKGADVIARQLCAGMEKGGKDACQGDSGGPLMLPKTGSYYLIGVVSYGFRCAEAGFPGIYTRVTSYLGWIAQNIK